MIALPNPTIHCTPPTDPAFLALTREAFTCAKDLLGDEMAVLVGTMVRIRWEYPRASLVAVSYASDSGQPTLVWLISRDGWTELDPTVDGQMGDNRQGEAAPGLA